MSESRDPERDDASQQPALLGRIRPVSLWVFRVLVAWMIFAWIVGAVGVAVAIWHHAHGR